jgi:hypothetical protein
MSIVDVAPTRASHAIGAHGSPTPVRYDGSNCLNLRSISSALDLLSDTSGSGRPIEQRELATALWFVEMCVTSRRIYFDGTTPDGDVSAATDRIAWFVETNALGDLEIAPIAARNPEETLGHATAALTESALLLDSFRLESSLDQAVAASEHDAFLQVVQAPLGSDRRARALELIEQRFRGSKCLAALVNAGPDVMALARRAYEQHPSEGPRVTGALINRFRLNYLNQLASSKRGAYAPNPNLEVLTKEHVRLFKDYLLTRMLEDLSVPRGRSNILIESLEESAPYPPLGLYALMLTPGQRRPVELLHTALERFKREKSLQRLIWEQTAEGLRLRASKADLEAYDRAVSEHFFAAYDRLEKEARGIEQFARPGQMLRKYLIPAAFGVLGSLLPVPPVVGAGAVLLKLFAGTTVGASLTALGDRLAGDGVNSYVSQYKKLAWNFSRDPALATPLAAIGATVERVFGRPLASGNPAG